MGSTPASPATYGDFQIAGWSSLVARQAHNLKAVGSNPAPATKNREVSGSRATRRTVAQPGSAFAWGAKGHEFKSRRSDHLQGFRVAKPMRCGGRAVRSRTANPLTAVQLRSAPPIFLPLIQKIVWCHHIRGWTQAGKNDILSVY